MKSTRFFLILLILFILVVCGEVIYLFNYQKNKASSSKNLTIHTYLSPTLAITIPPINNPDGSFIEDQVLAKDGFHDISSNPSIVMFIGRILQVSQDNSGIYLTASLGNIGEKKFILSDGKNIPIILVKQNTYNINPLSSQMKAQNLSADNITANLNPFNNHDAILTLYLTQPSLPQTEKIQSVKNQLNFVNKYNQCNQQFAKDLTAQSVGDISCTPLLTQINVYVPSL